MIGGVGPLFEFLSHYWWLIFVFGGSIGGAVKAIGAANQRRVERRQERFRIKQQTKVAVAQANAQGQVDKEAVLRDVAKTIDEHEQTDARWFGYEIDMVTLLDFPMMIDMREPLTIEFHKAKRHADLLKPSDPESLVGDPDGRSRYRDAVHVYAVAFDVAEKEATRRRHGDFDDGEQERLVRAQRLLRLAMNDGATQQERHSAYAKARKELEGLISIPNTARLQLERSIAGQIEA
ncbi:hypothetical protein [Rhodococcus sp. NPDC058521]|uniref:hypothetical protein n=1 Tax=Rhodococcus sp. NPDC058521 TaxID=3346536 RepID=UPI003668B49C